LKKNGNLTEEGWAKHPLFKYDKKMIHGNKLTIKEWDYYAVTNQVDKYTIAITISDLGFASVIALAYIDLAKGMVAQIDRTILLTLGSTKLSPSSTCDSYITSTSSKLRASFIVKKGKRHLIFGAPSLQLPDGRIGLSGDIVLTLPNSNDESINIATSWKENRKAFYLNEKINCLDVNGIITRGYDEEKIKPLTTFGVLDWGRGKWTYKNTWYWSSCSALIENEHFGFNLGYGFTDREPASENALFYKGAISKIEDVKFTIPQDIQNQDWIIESKNNRINLKFTPIVNRNSNFNLGLIKSVQNQTFGTFNGTAVLNDGTILNIKNLLGFAEKVSNRW
jgi:hypothetical protein